MLTFHAHLFFAPPDAGRARAVASALAEATGTTVVGWRDRAAGPLPQAQVQLGLTSAELGAAVQWLMMNRAGLSVLIHPETGDDLLDHTEHAVWLGTPLGLLLDRL